MPRSKTLFDAVEAEMRNARAAISNASIYLDMLKDAVDEIVKSTGMEAPLSLKNNDTAIVNGELKAELELL